MKPREPYSPLAASKKKRGARSRRGSQRGLTLVEMLVTAIIMVFLTTSTFQLYTVVNRQQLKARDYMNNQTADRDALRLMMRTIRHGSVVVTGSGYSNFA